MRRPLALAVLLLVPAAPARAATMDPLKACYVSAGAAITEREPIMINAQGFSANQTATVWMDGAVIQSMTQISPLGTISESMPAPFQARGQRPFTLSVVDNSNAANAVSAQSLVSALDVRVTPSDARPASRVRFRGRGFTGGPAVYGHYLRKGRLRKTVALATAGGACGTFNVRRRQLPIRHPHTGRWVLQIDQDRVWRAMPGTVSVTLVIDVTRRPRAGARTHRSQAPF